MSQQTLVLVDAKRNNVSVLFLSQVSIQIDRTVMEVNTQTHTRTVEPA